jgi:hypothetical protein
MARPLRGAYFLPPALLVVADFLNADAIYFMQLMIILIKYFKYRRCMANVFLLLKKILLN